LEVPFEMLVVFASNRDPAQLLYRAFLRGIQTKIKIGAVTEEQFFEIFSRVAGEHGMEADRQIVQDLIDIVHNGLGEELRACYPGDLVNQICWAARYEGVPPRFERAALMQAVETYFLARP